MIRTLRQISQAAYNTAEREGALEPHKTISRRLKPFYVHLEEAQELCDRLLSANQAADGPEVHIVEGLTGAGKTSFALSLAHKLAGEKGTFSAGSQTSFCTSCLPVHKCFDT